VELVLFIYIFKQRELFLMNNLSIRFISINKKLLYFLESLSKVLDRDFSCPSCGGLTTKLIYRKMMVVSLRECLDCGLRFRVPKDQTKNAIQFYQSDYEAGYITSLPSDEVLLRLVSAGFKGGEKDFSEYIQVLDAVGVEHGDKVLDFGASWGYGSWQLRQAGFNAYSYEISKLRAEYAKKKLGCQVIDLDNIDTIRGKISCVFVSHVLEHLPDPNIFWKIANQVLMPGGKVVCFIPSGEPELELSFGKKRYHQLWGKVHPLLFTSKALISIAKRYQYKPYVFSFPCPMEDIKCFKEGDLKGEELLLIAIRLS
jgi:transcription elongation factor Elf1